MNRLHRCIPSVICTAALCVAATAAEQKPTTEDTAFFENKIRPVLVQHCYECHSADSTEVGGKLLLDTRDALRQGGESGAAVVIGDAESSLIVQALQYDGLEMPPQQRLPDSVIADFKTWIQRGAADPRIYAQTTTAPAVATDLWSLQAPQQATIPEVSDHSWPKDPIDHFVLHRIETANLQPTDDADARTLIRRLHIDLIGLPPSMIRTQRFIEEHAADAAAATAVLVDELLASPQFGERWGRHWLDVARFGESNGNDGLGRNPSFPHAWRYRDYVIAAINADTPYDQFLTQQIAGDLLATDSAEERDRNLIATGFLALTAKPAKAMNNNFDMDVVADQIDVIGSGILGLSVACARCHDHKFDPIPTRDYYALAGFFTSSETMWGIAANEGLTAPPTGLHVLTAAPQILPPQDFKETVLVLESNTGIPKPIPKPPWPVGTPLAMGLRDRAKPADCKINIKGDAKKLGEPVPRGFLTACRTENTAEDNADDTPPSNHSGRLELAAWLTQPDHPLTARVMVNRVWQHLFGTGLVATPNDFGVYGARPMHPELLDYLAVGFVRDNWSLKRLIRQIVLSRSYQLSSHATSKLLTADDANQLLTRHARRRLDAESLRDSVLFASGELDLQPGEGSLIQHRDILINLAGNLHQPSHKRSIYLCYLRSSPPPELAAFDLPDFTTVVGRRDISTVPNQALHLYNNSFVIEQSLLFASRVMSESVTTDGRIQIAWHRAFGREPNDAEVRTAAQFILAAEYDLKDKSKAWASLCQALLTTNEFRYID